MVSSPIAPDRPILLLGRYALFDELARGGMATVHLGRLCGPAGFSKIVAIKKMHSNIAQDPQFLAMFLDEARVAGRIQHPNVVVVFDVVAVSGEAYLVMEYVDGEPLSDLVRASKKHRELESGDEKASGAAISPAIAVHIVRDALYGLHAAHEATDEKGRPLELVHRDISPQNILVGADGVARVLDFGIAKAVGRLQETQSGQIKGKVAYMAPEQLTSQSVDRRADVFAAGVVLWEALAGRRLFGGNSSWQQMYRVLETTVPTLDEEVPDLPALLVDAVAKATERDPAARFNTALEFAQELEKAVGLIPSHVVGQWVRKIAGEKLDQRRAKVRAIEALPLPTDPADASLLSLSSPVTTSVPFVRADADEITRAERPLTVATHADGSRWPFWLVAAGLTVVGAVFFLLRSPAVSQREAAGSDLHSAPAPKSLEPPHVASPPAIDATNIGVPPVVSASAPNVHAAPVASTTPSARSRSQNSASTSPVKRSVSPLQSSGPPGKRSPESLFSRL